MKKNLLKLATTFVLVLIAQFAMAQTDKYAPIELGKLYQVNCDRGTWVYANGKLTNDKISGMAPDTQSAAQQFAFVEYEDQLYIWNQEGAHFLNNTGQCVTLKKASPVTFDLQSDGTLFFHFTDAAGKYINMNDQGVVIDGWTTADPGNKMTLVEISDADMEAINAVIEEDMAVITTTITWNVKDANGNIVKTQSLEKCIEGDTYTTNIAAGFVTLQGNTKVVATKENQTIDLSYTIADDAPFKYSEGYKDANWYTMTIRGSKKLTYNEENDIVNCNTNMPKKNTLNEMFALVGNPFDVTIINAAMGADKALGFVNDRYRAVAAGEAAHFTFENNSGHFTFALNENPVAHVNDFANMTPGELGVWDAAPSNTDGGSTFVFAEVAEDIVPSLLFGNDKVALSSSHDNLTPINSAESLNIQFEDGVQSAKYVISEVQITTAEDGESIYYKQRNVVKEGNLDIVDNAGIATFDKPVVFTENTKYQLFVSAVLDDNSTIIKSYIFNGGSHVAPTLAGVDNDANGGADYVLQNVATGLFLNGANSWGTKASATKHGQFMTLAQLEDGKYTIDSHISNGGDNHFLGENNYVDSPAAGYVLDYNFDTMTWTIQAANGMYLSNNAQNEVNFDATEVSANAQWRIISKDDYLLALKEASFQNPVDATALIADANFGRNNTYFDKWEGDKPGKGGDFTNMNAEKWGGNSQTFDSYQTLTNLPNGTYTLSIQGYYRYNNTGDNTNDIAAAAHADGTEVINSYFYANEVEEPLMSIADEAAVETYGKMPFSQADASAAFNMGLYAKSLTVQVTDGTLKIGIKKVEHPGCDWTVWDNLELTYMGTEMPEIIPEAAPESEAPAGYAWSETLVKNGNFAGEDLSSFYVQGAGVTSSIVTIPGGAKALEVVSADKVTNAWDSQMFIISDEAFQDGEHYYVSFAYKAADNANVETQAHQNPGEYNHWAMLQPNPSFTTEWQAASWEGEVSGDQVKGIGMKSIAFNLNVYEKANKYYLANVVVKKLVRTQEVDPEEIPEAGEEPAVDEGMAWSENLVKNGNFAGEDLTSFVTTEQNGATTAAQIIDGPQGVKVLEIVTSDKQKETWDCQLFIVPNEPLQAGEKYYVTFSYKAEANASIGTQAHGTPGNYQHYEMIGNVAFKANEWKTTTWTGTISKDQAGSNGMGSIAFNLSDCATANKFYITNVVFKKMVEAPAGDPDLIEIAQDQGRQYDDFDRADLVEGNEYNTYTAHGNLSIAMKMMDIDVEGCDYVIVKFAEPVQSGWYLAFWNNQDLVKIPEGATEFKYVFAEDEKCDVKNGILPQICMMTFFDGVSPVAKVAGVYKHIASSEVKADEETGIENIEVATANGKFVKNGKIVIMKNGVMYNLSGSRIK